MRAFLVIFLVLVLLHVAVSLGRLLSSQTPRLRSHYSPRFALALQLGNRGTALCAVVDPDSASYKVESEGLAPTYDDFADGGARERTLNVGGFSSRISDIVTKSKLWGVYSVGLSTRPMYTKALSSALGFLIGDFLAQVFYVKRAFDIARFIRMGAFGAMVHAPLGHLFYGFLERRFPGVDVTALATKLAIDQIAWTPVFGSMLFLFVGISAGHSPNAIFRTVKNNLLKVVLTSWMIWPIAHTVNFKYITPKHRLLYINSVQVFFNAFLSIFSSGAR